MAYEEHNHAYRTNGRVLYQLCKIGVPITIVESVIFELGKLMIENHNFAEYEFDIVGNTPVFEFASNYQCYAKLPQRELMTVEFSDDGFANQHQFGYYFSDKTPERLIKIESIKKSFRIFNSDGILLNSKFEPVVKQTPIEDKFLRLKSALTKQK